MKRSLLIPTGTLFCLSLGAGVSSAVAQSHAGQHDTDGILSPGEVENPGIHYDRAQRNHERDGDYRVDNPDNDAAAAEDRDYRRGSRGQLGRGYPDDRRWNDRDYREREREREHRSWWDWW